MPDEVHWDLPAMSSPVLHATDSSADTSALTRLTCEVVEMTSAWCLRLFASYRITDRLSDEIAVTRSPESSLVQSADDDEGRVCGLVSVPDERSRDRSGRRGRAAGFQPRKSPGPAVGWAAFQSAGQLCGSGKFVEGPTGWLDHSHELFHPNQPQRDERGFDADGG